MPQPFQTIPVNIAGPSYQDRSRPLSAQETRNFYQEVTGAGKDKYVIKSFPGQLLFGAAGTTAEDRGMHRMNEIAYRVVGQSLYKILSDGSRTNLGTIPGVGRCIFADDGENMFITCNGVVNKYVESTGLITQVTDVSITGAKSVDYINNQFIYTFPALTVFSNVGDGSIASSLNAVNAESEPDPLVRDYVFDQVVYRFGTRSCEAWYNSGIGTPPFDRIEGQILNVGLAAIHSVNNSKKYMYWLGSDLQIYRARGGQEEPISTAAIAGAIQGYSYVGDAFSEIFTLDNHIIYMITFPTADKTWCLIEDLGVNGWFELSKGKTTGRYNAGSILEIYNKVLVGDNSTGDLYKLDFDIYDQNGSVWQRRRVMGVINGEILGQKGKRVQMSRMEFIIETGTGLTSGQGSTPHIMIEPSYDGGRTWATGTWLKVGKLGQFNVRAEWFNLNSFYEMVVRITTSDPVKLNIYSATIDLRLAGR